jgi:hypothetical protein
MASEIKVDTISENTLANGVTIDGVNIKDGTITGANLGRKNYIINGNFDIWQRGTSVTGQTSDQYLADRWKIIDSGATYSYQQGSFTAGQTGVPNNPKYFANITVTGADDNLSIRQPIEGVNTLAGETITVSFYAKYTTNAPTNFKTRIRQVFGSGGSTTVETDLATGQTLTTSWQKFTITATVPSISGKTIGSSDYLEMIPIWNPNNETYDFQIAQVQVEKGSVATDFEVRHIAEEQNLCDRYFQSYGGDSAYETIASGCAVTTTQYRGYIAYRTMMRVAPTSSITGDWEVNGAGTSTTSSETITRHGKSSGEINATIDTAKTAGQSFGFRSRNDTTARFTLDAEL